jgi:type I restriction enzyme M protein
MRVSMERIEKEGYNLNISRYISTAVAEEEIDLQTVNAEMLSLEQKITESKDKHNAFLKALGLQPLP